MDNTPGHHTISSVESNTPLHTGFDSIMGILASINDADSPDGITDSTPPHPRKKITTSSILMLIFLILPLIVLVSLIIGVRYTPTGDISIFGYIPSVVVSSSMEPEILKNGVILIKTCNIQSIKVGDIAVYQSSRGYHVVHRVFDSTPYSTSDNPSYYMKGDANTNTDGEILYSDNLVGVVAKIYNNSSINYDINTEQVVEFMVCGLVLYYSIYSIIVYLISSYRTSKCLLCNNNSNKKGRA